MAQTYLWRATAAFSLEGVVAAQLRRMGFADARGIEGGASFTGTMQDALRANLCLRAADRVMLEFGSFQALTFDQLFEGVRALPWEELLPRNAALPLTGKCARSQLMSVRDVQSITKKAVVERLKKAYKLNWLPEDGPSYPLDVHLHTDTATLCADASGAGLSRRGYRTWNGEAPLRETLAAACVMLSPWRPGMPLMDPMCGTGTLLIEAALIAAERAPGIGRAFAMEGWAQMPEALANEIRREVRSQERPIEGEFLGSDIDPEALELARRHAKAAGVQDAIRWECRPLAEATLEGERGCVITNPPYGERLGSREGAEVLYRELGRLVQRGGGWSLAALTSHPGFERAFGRRADKRRRLFNGRIECELMQFLPKGN